MNYDFESDFFLFYEYCQFQEKLIECHKPDLEKKIRIVKLMEQYFNGQSRAECAHNNIRAFMLSIMKKKKNIVKESKNTMYADVCM